MSISDENKIENKIDVAGHLGLVHLCAKKFVNRGIDYEELYSSGCIGLVKAANNFDISKGYKFSTYAIPYILGEIKHIFSSENFIKVSSEGRKELKFIEKSRRQLEQKLGKEPTLSELASYVNISEEKLGEILLYEKSRAYNHDGEPETAENKASDENIEDFTDRKIMISEIMKMLSDEERNIIVLRYFDKLSQQQTAARLGLYQVQVSRAEKKILKRIRKEYFCV